MRPLAAHALRAFRAVALFAVTTAGIPTNGIPTNGIPTNGIPTNGIPTNGIPTNGIPTNGIPTNGIPTNGANLELLETSLLFGNQAVHEALIGRAFTQANLTDPFSPVFQAWSDPYSTLLLSYLWQDAHAAGDDLVFTAPSGATYRFYGNVGVCDKGSTGWARNTALDDGCARWVSALIITQINQSGIHNLFSARGPSLRGPALIGPQLTDMAPALHSFDYKFGTSQAVEALHDVCAPGITGPENCGWQPGLVGTGTPGASVKVSLSTNGEPTIVQVNQGIMAHDYPLAAKGSCAGAPPGCTDPDVLAVSIAPLVDPVVTFTIPPSGVFNVQYTAWARDDLASRNGGSGIAPPVMTAQIASGSGSVRFPSDELDVFPSSNREMTAWGNIFGSTNVDPALWVCEARLGTGYAFAPFAFDRQPSRASAINDAGRIVGELVGDGSSDAFVRDPDGTVTLVDPPNRVSFAAAYGINAGGQIVGTVDGADGSTSFLRNADGTFISIDVFEAPTTPRGINGAGRIIGFFVPQVIPTEAAAVASRGGERGFMREPDGEVSALDVPDALATFPFAINDAGEIAGAFSDDAGDHGFVRDLKGGISRVDVPGAGATYVTAINDAGFMAGIFRDSDCSEGMACVHGFVRAPDGTVAQVDAPGATATEVLGLDSSGSLSGTLVNANGGEAGFYATLAGTQLCDSSDPESCTPCTRGFRPGELHVIFPNAHMWLSRNWTNAQDYYRARSCSSDLSTCIASFEGYIDAPFTNPSTNQTVPACLTQSADTDSHTPTTYSGAPRPLSDGDGCFVSGSLDALGFTVTTFFPNYRDFGACGALGPQAISSCAYAPPSRIAFASGRSGNGDIYVMNPDGSNPVAIAPDPALDLMPALSPDGRKVAFVSLRTGHGDLYLGDVVNPSAPPFRIAGDCALDARPVWSPLGDRLAFVSTRSGNGDVYVVNADGSGLRNVSNDAAPDFSPAFSPDGTKLVFVSLRTGFGDLYLVNLGDPKLTAVRLTSSLLPDLSPAFRPNAPRETIAFVRGAVLGDIYLLDVASRAATPLVRSAAPDFAPAFSPDGGRLAFVSTRTGNSDVWLVNADGTGLRNLTASPGQDFSPVFSPDGAQVAFVSTRDGDLEIYAADVQTGAAANLSRSPGIDAAPSWR